MANSKKTAEKESIGPVDPMREARLANVRGKYPVDILLCEDNPGDVRLTREVLKETGVISTLNVVSDGEEALDYLRHQGRHEGSTRPDLIILDLNMPKRDGREVLKDIKSDPVLLRIPVIVLTASEAERDINMCYDLHANCYIAKPINLDDFISVLKLIDSFWLSMVKLPTKPFTE